MLTDRDDDESWISLLFYVVMGKETAKGTEI